MIYVLFGAIVISLILNILSIYDESPLAEAFDFFLKIILVLVMLIYLLNTL